MPSPRPSPGPHAMAVVIVSVSPRNKLKLRSIIFLIVIYLVDFKCYRKSLISRKNLVDKFFALMG
jgi:hypothetical protein